MSYQDVVEKAIDKRIDAFNQALESDECDALDNALYHVIIGVLEDLKKEIL